VRPRQTLTATTKRVRMTQSILGKPPSASPSMTPGSWMLLKARDAAMFESEKDVDQEGAHGAGPPHGVAPAYCR
jgi:hypothetical protein